MTRPDLLMGISGPELAVDLVAHQNRYVRRFCEDGVTEYGHEVFQARRV
jgi:hypothetical protein